MTIIIPSPQLLIHAKNKDYVTQISHREHKSRNFNSNFNSILDDCTINLSLMCFNGVNPAIHQARVYSSVIISDFIELNNPKNPLFYGSLAASANDFENAIYWYKIAAKRKSTAAMIAIGLLYLKIYKTIQINGNGQLHSTKENASEEIEDQSNWFNFINFKKDAFYKKDFSKEALKWFYRAYKFGSIQSLQYIAMVFEKMNKKPEALHFYRKHYEKTIHLMKLTIQSSFNAMIESNNSIFKLKINLFSSLYSKYKIARLLNSLNYDNYALIWFISCAENNGHLKSVQRLLEIVISEKNSKSKSYEELYSTFLNKLNNNFIEPDNINESSKTIEKNIRIAKIIAMLRFKFSVEAATNKNVGIEYNSINKNFNSMADDNNYIDKSNSINDNNNNINFNSNDDYNNITSSNDAKFDFESPIYADTALDFFGWNMLKTMFSSQIQANSSYTPKQPYSSKPLEVPSFKSVLHTFWLIEPLTISTRSILQYEPSQKSGSSDIYSTTPGNYLVLKGFNSLPTNQKVNILDQIQVTKDTKSNNKNNNENEALLSFMNSSFSRESISPPKMTSQFLSSSASSLNGQKKMKFFPSILPAFYPSASKTQYLHLAFKFASPSFLKRNLQMSFLFLQKMWLNHPKGISESSLFRNKCKSNKSKYLVQCGFISILCHDSKFALDLFTKAAKLGNETGSLMTGLLMFHGLNVLRQVKNGCFYLSQCSTDPIALLHLSLACNDETYEIRAKEALGIYSSSLLFDDSDMSNSFIFSNLHNNNKDENKNANGPTDSNDCQISQMSPRYKMYEWVGDLFSNSVKLPLNVGIALMFYGIALKKAEDDGNDINGIIKKISMVSREPAAID